MLLLSCGRSRPVWVYTPTIRGASKQRPYQVYLGKAWTDSEFSSRASQSSSSLIPSSFIHSFSLSVCQQISVKHLVCVFCSKNAAVLKIRENYRPPCAFVDLGREGWCGSLARIEGARCSLLRGKSVQVLVHGHMGSSGRAGMRSPGPLLPVPVVSVEGPDRPSVFP